MIVFEKLFPVKKNGVQVSGNVCPQLHIVRYVKWGRERERRGVWGDETLLATHLVIANEPLYISLQSSRLSTDISHYVTLLTCYLLVGLSHYYCSLCLFSIMRCVWYLYDNWNRMALWVHGENIV